MAKISQNDRLRHYAAFKSFSTQIYKLNVNKKVNQHKK